ncbi:MAG: phosphoribosylamine--glycine ligase [Synechococcus sp.]
MHVLVVGSGGREHALVWKLSQSTIVSRITCAPGNVGLAQVEKCTTLPLSVTDFDGLIEFARNHDVELAVIGPEVPLVAGIADAFKAAGIKVFGPTQDGALLEGSKSWSKQLMDDAGVPTARSQTFTAAADAIDYLNQQSAPIVVKADGLAAGKGVTVAGTIQEAIDAVTDLFSGTLGDAGSTVVIEDFLVGQEASVLAFTDGQTILPMVAAQDHKQVGEGDTGPNTGGMGAYAPTPIAPPEVMEQVLKQVLEPTLKTLCDRGITYQGVLYAGLMIAPDGQPSVVEFNCRFGDPETQVVLPLLKSDLATVMLACAEGKLHEIDLEWHDGYAACVVMASGGYPGAYEKGKVISGLESTENTAVVFHAGTAAAESGDVVTNGGRVLGITGRGNSLQEALDSAYQAISSIQFEGAYYRSDIGFRVMGNG